MSIHAVLTLALLAVGCQPTSNADTTHHAAAPDTSPTLVPGLLPTTPTDTAAPATADGYTVPHGLIRCVSSYALVLPSGEIIDYCVFQIQTVGLPTNCVMSASLPSLHCFAPIGI